MKSPLKIHGNTLCGRFGQNSMLYRRKSFTTTGTPQGYCDHRDIYRHSKKECHEIG